MAAVGDIPEQSTNIYISRHLQRIDDTDSNNPKQQTEWYSNHCTKPEFSKNPYLTDKAYETTNIDKTVEKFPAVDIDIIITSPFLRCIQTSYILLKKINEIKINASLPLIEQIHVNFKLSELVNSDMFFNETLPLNIQEIYEFSKKYINEHEKKLSTDILNEYQMTPILIDDTNPEDRYNDSIYYERIKDAIREIKLNFPGKNILLVTHSDSGIIFQTEGLKYTEVIKVPDDFRNKYLKYKNKYLEIKLKNVY